MATNSMERKDIILKTQLQKLLTVQDIDRLRKSLGASEFRNAKMKSFLEIWEALERRGKIRPSKYTCLKQILKDNQPAVKLIESVEKGMTSKDLMTLETEQMDQIPTNKLSHLLIKGLQKIDKTLISQYMRDEHGTPLLIVEAKMGGLEMVKIIVKKGIDVDMRDHKGRTALMWAAAGGHPHIVQYLLDRGARVTAQDEEGETSLMLAAVSGHLDIVERLLRHADTAEAQEEMVRAADRHGATALLRVCYLGHTQIAQLLIQRGASVHAVTTRGVTCVMAAACSQNAAPLVRMLIRSGASVSGQDMDGRTALHYAALFGDRDTCQTLLKAGADVNVVDKYEETPAQTGKRRGHGEMMTDVIKTCQQTTGGGLRKSSPAAAAAGEGLAQRTRSANRKRKHQNENNVSLNGHG